MNKLDFFPPIAVKIARKLVRSSMRRPEQYASYADALAHCTQNGYGNSDIVNVVLEKTKLYQKKLLAGETNHINATSAYSLCSLLASIDSQELNVLDFGGACGAHYFLARAVIPSSIKLNWVVVETPEMAAVGNILSTDELCFTADLGEALSFMKRVDLIHTSGTLQCVDTPFKYLHQLVSTNASHILFNRLGLTEGDHDVITVHESWLSWNGPGPMPDGFSDQVVRYPFCFPRKSTFYDILKQRYDVVMTFDDPSGIYPVGSEPIVGVGVLARLRHRES